MKTKILNYILRNFTDYYEIKNKNTQLESEINLLIEEPESIEAMMLISSYRFKYNVEKQIISGEVSNGELTGILNHIEN
jgi:hypothetical protein